MRSYFPLRPGHFEGGANHTGDGRVDIAQILNEAAEDLAAAPQFTTMRMHFTIDPIGGDDEAKLVEVLEQDPDGLGRGPYLTQTARLKSLRGLRRRLPLVWRHPIHADLVDGDFDEPIGIFTGGPEVMFSGYVVDEEARLIDPITFEIDAQPGLYINGAKNVTLAPTVANIVGAAQIGNSGLSMTVDAHRGSMVEITEGPGVGEWNRAIRNSATTLQVARAWLTTPTGASKFRIWKPASRIRGALVFDNISSGFSSGIFISPEIEVAAQPGQVFALLVSTSAVLFGGTISSESIGARIANIGPHAVLYTAYAGDLWNDFNGKRMVGMYAKDGEFLVYLSFNVVLGNAVGSVYDRAYWTINDHAVIDLKCDADGSNGGARTAVPFYKSSGGGQARFQKCDGAGSTIKRYQYGASLDRFSYLNAASVDLSDHGVDGILVTGSSGANLRGTTSATPNVAYGATVKGQSHALINRATTTLTGGTTNCRLGNAVSGTNRLWTAVPAGDALADPVELAVLRDQTS